MRNLFLPALSLVFALLVTTGQGSAQDELADRILEYFPGKWVSKDAQGNVVTEVDWKKVADGKAVAGAGTENGHGSFSMAGWNAEKKAWIHNGFDGSGAHVYLEVDSFEGDTYHGKVSHTAGDGTVVSGPWKCRIIDRNHFEMTTPTEQGEATFTWARQEGKLPSRVPSDGKN